MTNQEILQVTERLLATRDYEEKMSEYAEVQQLLGECNGIVWPEDESQFIFYDVAAKCWVLMKEGSGDILISNLTLITALRLLLGKGEPV